MTAASPEGFSACLEGPHPTHHLEALSRLRFPTPGCRKKFDSRVISHFEFVLLHVRRPKQLALTGNPIRNRGQDRFLALPVGLAFDDEFRRPPIATRPVSGHVFPQV
jgi:hypothetical protein